MKKKNLESSDIIRLKSFSEGNYLMINKSKVTPFTNAESVYCWTNEKMKLYPKENLEDKRVLTVTSSGDHALNLVLMGAKDIHSLDINVFCKYYSALKIAMIKKYDYSKFFYEIDKIICFDFDNNISKILEDVSLYLTDEERKFWNVYSSLHINFFCGPTYPKQNIYDDKEKYNELKDRLDDVNIKYYDGDIFDVNKILKGNKYDYIYLSNVIERINASYDKREKLRKNVIKKMSKRLNDEGVIYNYFLGLAELNMNDAFGDYIKYVEKIYDVNCFVGDYEGYRHEGIMSLTKK